jgi:N-acyl-D-aspartate/D-glutamate deacylase
MFDLILTNGYVIDGTGGAPFKASLGIKGERIEAVDLNMTEGSEIIDLAGGTVAPGFIDIHTHSDVSFFKYNVWKARFFKESRPKLPVVAGYPLCQADQKRSMTSENILD